MCLTRPRAQPSLSCIVPDSEKIVSNPEKTRVCCARKTRLVLMSDFHCLFQLEVTQLRKLAAARGLANSRLRAKVWPLLLGIETDAFPYSKYDDLAHQDHSDTHTLKADIARSLWSFTQGWTDEARDEKRKALMRLINAAVNYHAGKRMASADAVVSVARSLYPQLFHVVVACGRLCFAVCLALYKIEA